MLVTVYRTHMLIPVRGRNENEMHRRAALLIAIFALQSWAAAADTTAVASLPSRTFTEAYGTFLEAEKAIDGDRKTFAFATEEPYRGDFFLIVRFPNPSLVRNFKVYFEGKSPKDYFVEMSPNAIGYQALEIGEKTSYIRVRIPGKKGDSFRIAEIECNSEVASVELFAPVRIEAANVETTSAIINASFTKPVRLSVSYGLEPRPDAMKSFTEYTSYQHSYQIRLSELAEGLNYYARVKAITAEGEVYVTEDTNFVHIKLLGTPPLRVVTTGVGYISPLAISIVIQTNIPSHAVYYFGQGSAFTNIGTHPNYDTYHVFEFKDLHPMTAYNYMVFLSDHRGMNIVLPKSNVSTAEINIAKHKRVIAGTFTQLREPGFQGGAHSMGDTVLQRLTDGRDDYFNGMAHSEGLTAADQYAVIDLGREYALESHATMWRQLAFPKYYEIYTSVDNKTWTKNLSIGSDRIDNAIHKRSGGGDPLLVCGAPFNERVRARYVKLLIPRKTPFYRKHKTWSNVDLAEIMVFPGGDEDEINRIVREEWQP